MKNNIELVNETTILSTKIKTEINNALDFLPKGMKELINLYGLKFFYQENIISYKEGLEDKSSAGLFFINDKTNKPEIYILVHNEITAGERLKTLIHELGHFIDYAMFNHYFKDNEFYYDYSFWSFADDLFDYKMDSAIRDVFKKELYPTWGEDYNYFNLSLMEQFAETFKLLFMDYISDVKYPEYATLYNKFKQQVESSIPLMIKSKKKEIRKEKISSILSKLYIYKKEEEQISI